MYWNLAVAHFAPGITPSRMKELHLFQYASILHAAFEAANR